MQRFNVAMLRGTTAERVFKVWARFSLGMLHNAWFHQAVIEVCYILFISCLRPSCAMCSARIVQVVHYAYALTT
jgi:hypothetical protein